MGKYSPCAKLSSVTPAATTRLPPSRWASNARDPVLQKMQQKLREGGALTKPDVDEWVAWSRSRDYSPSIEDQRVYRRRRPGDAEEMMVDIQAGSENRLDLEIHSR